MPRSYSVNGHVLLNGEKMSKSTGNFMTLREAVDTYSADATRIALANAGSGLDDANFTSDNAKEAIEKLYDEMQFCKNMIDQVFEYGGAGVEDAGDVFWDKVFDNSMNMCVKNGEDTMNKMHFQNYIVKAFYELLSARDAYFSKVNAGVIEANYSLYIKYLKVHLALINPICPHYARHIWNYGVEKGILSGHPDEIVAWPTPEIISDRIVYLDNIVDTFCRKVRTEFMNTMKKLKQAPSDREDLTLHATMFSSYSEKETQVIAKYKEIYDRDPTADPKNIVREIMQGVKEKKDPGFFGRFSNFIKVNIIRFGYEFFEISLGENMEAFELVTRWAPVLLTDISDKVTNFDIKVKSGDEESMKQNKGPLYPIIDIA